MTTFAHIETGKFNDVRQAASVDAYKQSFAGTDASGWIVVAVADATVEGTNAPDTRQPAVMSAAEFSDYRYAILGAIALPSGTPAQQQVAGITRSGAVLLACKNTSDPSTFEAYTRFMQGTTFHLEDVEAFLAMIGPNGSKITTQAENDAVIGGWPRQ